MPLIRPFPALRPIPERAYEVLAPPYDVLSSVEARERSKDRPWSFLHISKAEIDLPPGISSYDPFVYRKAAENLARMRAEKILMQDGQPYYYLYRLVMGEHQQTGLAAVVSVADYDSNRIRKHEFTRLEKEEDRVRQIETLNAQTGPVLLVYRANSEVDETLDQVTQATADMDVTADDGVRHLLWVVRDQALLERLTELFDQMESLYVADGHHRSAAASRVAATRREANAAHSGEEAYNYFLAVVFPHDQMQVLSYNRVVQDLNGLDQRGFLDRVAVAFRVAPTDRPVQPGTSGELGMYLPGRWFRLRLAAESLPKDPVARLDVSLLADNLLEPILEIQDPRRDSRIDFVGGIRGLGELERRVDSGEMAVAFSLFPTRMEDLMAAADARKVMPPKSTWFEPKLADGAVSHLLD